jgi:hypothetical protein
MANMHPDGAYAFVMRNVKENPSSVIATLKRQLTPKVLGHMHSDSILSTHVVVDFKEYHFVQLCFDDLLSDSEWHERMHESRHLALARIMRDMDAFKRVLDMADSPSNGITFCQGNFAAMPGVVIPDAIRYFGGRGKIFFAHFRDIRGSVPLFEETFHDEGKTDMAEAMRAYLDVGYDGPMRPDHAPTMEGEDNANPGYMVRGQIFAVGYMKGLIDSARAGR